MRSVVLATAVAVLSIPSALSAGSHQRILELPDLSALETKAAHAPPRERCFHYAKLVHSVVDAVWFQRRWQLISLDPELHGAARTIKPSCPSNPAGLDSIPQS